MFKKGLSSKARWVLIGILVVVGLFWAGIYRLLQPRFGTASLAEIESVLPKELLVRLDEDGEAQKRYRRLALEAHRIDLSKYAELRAATGTDPSTLAVSRKFRLDNAMTLHNIDDIIRSGNVEKPNTIRKSPSGTTDDLTLQELPVVLAASGRQFAAAGDFDSATGCFLIAIRISDACASSARTCWDYVGAMIREPLLLENIGKVATKGSYPADDCRKLLQALAPVPGSDGIAARAMIADFQNSILPALQNPAQEEWANVDGSPVGNYQPIETAARVGKLYLQALSNEPLPVSKRDLRALGTADLDRKRLPKYPADSFRTMLAKAGIGKSESPEDRPFSKSVRNILYRLQMNRIPNSIGRMLISILAGTLLQVADSSRPYALRETLRTTLAVRMYMAAHAGSPPPNLAALVPNYLDRMPRDPYNGKPLIYHAADLSVESAWTMSGRSGRLGFSITR